MAGGEKVDKGGYLDGEGRGRAKGKAASAGKGDERADVGEMGRSIGGAGIYGGVVWGRCRVLFVEGIHQGLGELVYCRWGAGGELQWFRRW